MEQLTALRQPRLPFVFEPPVCLGDVDVRPGVRFGAHSYMNSGRVASDCYIGRYCSIGYNVTIGTGHHDLELLSTSSWFESDAPPSIKNAGKHGVRVRIKNDVWIGDNALIMNGVTVGNGAVIGAAAVVTKDVPDYAVVVGLPARVLKMRFDDEIIERLLAIRWWEFNDALLKQHRLTSDIQASLAFLEQVPECERTAVAEYLIRLPENGGS